MHDKNDIGFYHVKISNPQYTMLGIKDCIRNNISPYHNGSVVHRIIFVRHGETNCNVNLMQNGMGKFDLDSYLTENGAQQAVDVAKFFESQSYIPDNILCSPLARTVSTAKPFAKDRHIELVPEIVENNRKKDITVHIGENTFTYKKETDDEFRQRIYNLFNKQKEIGSLTERVDTVCFTHSGVIAAILGMYQNLTNYNINNYFHLSNCSITCIDILAIPDPHTQLVREKQTHITTVNYTKHISNPSGHHNCLI